MRVDVLCWIDRVCLPKNVRDPSICFVHFFVCRTLSPHLRV